MGWDMEGTILGPQGPKGDTGPQGASFGDVVVASLTSGVFSALDLSVPGLYRIRGGTGYVTDMPTTTVGLWWNVILMDTQYPTGANAKLFLAHSATTNVLYYRMKYGTTWGAWAAVSATTLSSLTQAEAEAGTATTSRAISASVLKGAVYRWTTGSYTTAPTALGQSLSTVADAAAARALIGVPEAIKGDTGPKGDTGETGLQGPQGIQGVSGIIGNSSAQARRTTTQTVNFGTDTLITFNQTAWAYGDVTVMSYGLQVSKTGIYQVSAVCPWAAGEAGRRNLKVLRNSTSVSGAVLIQAQPAIAWENVVSVAGAVSLIAGDTLRLMVAHDQGATLNIVPIGAVYCSLSATLVAAS